MLLSPKPKLHRGIQRKRKHPYSKERAHGEELNLLHAAHDENDANESEYAKRSSP